ncbi:hypothetical protein [Pseudomonas sp. PA1(2017)]|uniref:hypothetical protein n=1 Tax=Pseudomonas sp. PA1(2017) TaxID=1932113 RepID=UPI00143D5C26|nr:hypothetical protein [Pseudomonas sp. PA1(2017)]
MHIRFRFVIIFETFMRSIGVGGINGKEKIATLRSMLKAVILTVILVDATGR